MAGSRKSLPILITAALLMGFLFFINEARPLDSAKLDSVDSIVIKNFVDGLFIQAIKDSGPSSGGHGHKATTIAETMEENKTGGPRSGGRGHEAITDEMLKENKRSGPSPGQGN